MANLNSDNLVYGYFKSETIDKVYEYIQLMLNKYNESIIIRYHISNIFYDPKRHQSILIHQKKNKVQKLILDPTMQDVYEKLSHIASHAMDVEHFDNHEGSGFVLEPDTTTHWLSIYPCQPNKTPVPPEEEKIEVIGIKHNTKFDSNYYRCIALYLKHKHNFKKMTTVNLPAFFQTIKPHVKIDWKSPDVHINEVPALHQKLFPDINLCIFTKYGNIWYLKHTDLESDEFCYLYHSDQGKLSIIYDIHKFFRQKKGQIFCLQCYHWHGRSAQCKAQREIKVQNTNTLRVAPKSQKLYPLVCYADFEAITPEDQEHQISGYAYMIIDAHGNVIHEDLKSNEENLDKKFLQSIHDFCEKYHTVIKSDNPVGTKCMLCFKPFNIHDINVYTGGNFKNGYTGSYHAACWKHRDNGLPILFHNFKGYDSHLLIEAIVEQTDVDFLQGKSLEKFNQINTWAGEYQLIFKDSYNFVSKSLASWNNILISHRYTQQSNKGVFPYDWFDSFDKLNAKELPPGPWFNKLTQTYQDREKAVEEWNRWECETFQDYHDIYMLSDVQILTDCYEQFRRAVHDKYHVDPVYFQGAPSLTWYLATHEHLEDFYIINDRDIYIDIQNQIRGGVAQAMVRYADVNLEEETIVFFDVNSLYSKCMTYPLPTEYIQTYTVGLPRDWELHYTMESEKCLLICATLTYPSYLHDRDWAYPMCPHPFNERLCTTFERKEKILLHHEALKYYVSMGMKIEEIHYAYEFYQKALLKDYVESNIAQRKQSTSTVETDLYKLLNNSLYGKTCENVFRYRKFGVLTQKEYQNGKVNPELDDVDIVDYISVGEYLLVERENQKILLKKPVQIGFTILEFAKLEIYKFLHILQNHYGALITPMYTDTDSLMIHCQFPNAYYELYNHPDIRPHLDYAGIDYGDMNTKKESGLWSPEEDPYNPIVKYVGLRAKTYCYQFADGKTIFKNKGIPMKAIEKGGEITMEDYERVLKENSITSSSFYKIGSKHHHLSTTHKEQVSLASHDDKRIVIDELHISVPFGYKGDKFKQYTI